jgi:hypothetical protein
MMLKIDVFAPMPMARDNIATKAKPGFLVSIRAAYAISLATVTIRVDSLTHVSK